MCLAAFAIDARAELPLLLAANRDEALDRPTLPLHRWRTPRGTPVVGGRDGREGGTWLAMTDATAARPRVALLTNVREGLHPPPAPRSRGELPLRWLDGAALPALLRELDPADYGGFNLIVGELPAFCATTAPIAPTAQHPSAAAHPPTGAEGGPPPPQPGGQWHWISNRPPATPCRAGLHVQALAPGVYGLSNAALDTPWPKTEALKAALERALPQWMTPQQPAAEQALWHALSDRHTWPDPALPQTGVPLPWERALSAIWVDHPSGYGTRTSALLAVVRAPGAEQGWAWRFQEHTWRPAATAGRRALAWVTSSSTGCTDGPAGRS